MHMYLSTYLLIIHAHTHVFVFGRLVVPITVRIPKLFGRYTQYEALKKKHFATKRFPRHLPGRKLRLIIPTQYLMIPEKISFVGIIDISPGWAI